MYKVIVPFTDLQDGNRVYQEGDTYPAEGAKSTKKRTEELLSADNKREMPVIEEVKE